MPISVEITDENLLQAVVDLPAYEFENLIAKAKRMRRDLPESREKREVELIKKVNETMLSDDEQKRFDELVGKRRDEIISGEELDELIALTEKSESLNVKRLEYLAEIAQIKDTSLREVMKALEVFPPQTI
jgi:hypothetical protein